MSLKIELANTICNITGDLTEKQYDLCLKKLEIIKVNPSKEKFEWPLFKSWFETNFISEIRIPNLKDFFNSKSMNSNSEEPIMFGQIMMLAIKKFFIPNMFTRFEDFSGLNFYFKINKTLSEINGLTEVILVKKVIDLCDGKSLENLAKELAIIGTYIPGIKALSTHIFCANLPRSEVGNFMKLLGCFKAEDCSKAVDLNIKEVYFEYKEFKNENILDWNQNEVNAIEMKKIKCFKCGKLGHFKKNCNFNNRKPKKEESNMVVGLLGDSDIEEEEVNMVIGENNHSKIVGDEDDMDIYVSDDEVDVFDNVDYLGEAEACGNVELEDKQNEYSFNVTEHGNMYDEFLIDCGATVHIVNDESLLHNIRNEEINLYCIEGKRKYHVRGEVHLPNGIILKNAVYVSKSLRNIISLTALNEDGYDSSQVNGVCRIYSGDKLMMEVNMKNKLYLMKIQDLGEVNSISETTSWLNEHKKLGHASINQLKNLGISYDGSVCESCVGNVNKTLGVKNPQNLEIGEMIHADLIGPINKQYALVCVDQKSKFTISYVLNSKSEASSKAISAIKVFNNLLRIQNKSVVQLRVDNEFDTNAIKEYCENLGIILQLTAPHSSYQNGVAENANKLLKRKIKLLLYDSGLDESFWVDALRHAVFLLNYIPRNNNIESPWKILTKRDKNIKNILPFGCLTFFYNYQNKQKIFTEYKSGVFIGFDGTTQIAKIYDVKENKIIRTSAFKGIENVFPLQKEEWFDRSSSGSGELKSREGNTSFDNSSYDNTDIEYERPSFGSHTGTYGGSFGSFNGNSISIASPPDTSTNTSTSELNKEVISPTDFTIDTDVDMESSHEFQNEYDTAEIENESDTMDIDEEDHNNQSSELISSVKERQVVPTKAHDTKNSKHYNKSNKKIQPEDKSTRQLRSGKKKPMITNFSENSDNSDSNEFIDASDSLESGHFSVNNELIKLNKLQQAHTSHVIDQYSQLLDRSKDLWKMSKENFVARPLYIPRESGLIPVSKKQQQQQQQQENFQQQFLPPSENRRLLKTRGDASGELIPRPAPGPLEPTIKASKRPDFLFAQVGASKRRIQQGNSFEINQRSADDEVQPFSTVTSKHYIDLKNQERNNLPVSGRSSFTTSFSKPHVKGGEIPTSEAQKQLPSSNVYKQITGGTSMSEDVADIMHEANVLVDKMKYIIPNTYKQALRTPQSEQWKKAAAEEFKSMNDKSVYTLIPRNKVPKGSLIVKSRWVFTVKQDPITNEEKFKGRIVAKGFTQEKGVNYIDKYSPVMRFETLRLAIGIAAIKQWGITQLDAKNAFLNGKLDYDVYLDPPEGTTKGTDIVWKLHRSLYGLKQSPRIWYLTVAKVLIDSGFQNSVLEPCLFWKNNCLLILYVDDILIVGKNERIRKEAAEVLSNHFEMKDLGKPKVFLGITIEELEGKKGYSLSMKDTIDKVKKDYQIEITKRELITPIVKGFDKNEINSPLLNKENHKKYRSIVGTLLFIANTVRLDISFTVSYLSRFLESPTEYHLKGAIRTLHYIVQTKNFKLIYKNSNRRIQFEDFRYIDKTEDVVLKDYSSEKFFKLDLISDSDWAGDTKDRKSQSGNIIMLNGNIIDWCSRKQNAISGSSTESEYIAMSDGLKDALSIKNLLSEMKIPIGFINVVGDNCSALTLAAHNTQHKRTKHIDIRFHFIRNLVDNKQVKLNYINTTTNLADLLTKFLDSTTFKNLKKILQN